MAMLEIFTNNIPPALPPFAFVFKLNPLPDDVDPFLVPVIDRPNFNIIKGKPPGIKQIIEGDLGITENIVSKTLDPTISQLGKTTQTVPVIPFNSSGVANTATIPVIPNTASFGIKSPKGTTTVPSPNIPAIGNSTADVSDKFNFPSAGKSLNDAQKAFLNNAVPQDAGLKSFEKMTIQSMLESQKPTLELVMILIQMLEIIEDCIARFLGSSIKIPIINTWIGIPSKNPSYTKGALSYKNPNSKNAAYISKINRQAINLTVPAFPDTRNYGGVAGGDIPIYQEPIDTQLAYYIGYFDEDGVQITPPNWVINSNKWFGKIFDINNLANQVEQLSAENDQGVQQLRDRYAAQQNQLELEKQKMVAEYYKQYKLANTAERENISAEREYAIGQYNEIKQEALNGIEENIYSEWFTKNATAQIKNSYQVPFISTAQPVTDEKGNAIDPFVKFPKLQIKPGVEVEIPVIEAENQLQKKLITIDGKPTLTDVIVTESNTSKVQIVKPKIDSSNKVNFFSHIKPNINDVVKNPTTDSLKRYVIPKPIKKYFLDWDYEIVLDYEIRSIKTGKVLGTEQEVIPARINFERDYQLRLIRVINAPLAGAANGKPVIDKKFFIGIDYNPVTTIVNKVPRVSQVPYEFFKTRAQLNITNINNQTGTALFSGNNIPLNYQPNDNNNTYSPDVLNLDNQLLEGEVYHGLDPRYIDATKWKVFWLVEAIRKDENDEVWINGKKVVFSNDAENAEKKKEQSAGRSGGKQWYGLLDKFTVIPKLIGGLLPLITRKFIPLLVKIIQILTNPTKIGELVNLILQDKLNKLFGMFNKKGTEDANKVAVKNAGINGASGKYNYKDKNGNVSNVLDGKANAKILIADVNFIVENGKVKLVSKSKYKQSKLKDQPIMKFILNLVKMPFDIIKGIIDFFKDFVKKLLNPLKLLGAIIDFVTFKWLIKILSPKKILSTLGPIDQRYLNPDTSLESDIDNNLSNINEDQLFSDMQAAMRGNGPAGLVEVFVYHIFKNGKFVREEIEEKPFKDPLIENQKSASLAKNFENVDLSNVEANAENLNGAFGNAENPSQKSPANCGKRTININKLIPLPLMSQMPKMNNCEMTQIFLKPLEIVANILRLIEDFINALISIPLSIFGLEPHIKFPKLNFADKLLEFIEKLKAKYKSHIVPPISPLIVPPNVKNLTNAQLFG
jgi:hypothetical protein